jgi:hypothetical protein
MTPAEKAERARADGKATQKAAAQRRQRWEKDFAQLRCRLAVGMPELAGPTGIGSQLDDLASAKTHQAWDRAVSGLIARLLRIIGRGGDARGSDQYIAVTGRLTGLLTNGFVPPAAKVSDSAAIQHEAGILEHEQPRTLRDAVAVLDQWERTSLLPGQEFKEEPAKTRNDRLRRRAETAAKAAGIKLATRPKAPSK